MALNLISYLVEFENPNMLNKTYNKNRDNGFAKD